MLFTLFYVILQANRAKTYLKHEKEIRTEKQKTSGRIVDTFLASDKKA